MAEDDSNLFERRVRGFFWFSTTGATASSTGAEEETAGVAEVEADFCLPSADLAAFRRRVRVTNSGLNSTINLATNRNERLIKVIG